MQKNTNNSDFTHSLETYSGREVIVIEDLNLGSMSVTNDIENVVEYISKLEHINPANYMIVYKDSSGIWDGWDYKTQLFISLGEDNWKDAVSKYIQLQLSKCHS